MGVVGLTKRKRKEQMNRPTIIKMDVRNISGGFRPKVVKRNDIYRLHGRRLVSASMLNALLKLTDKEPGRIVRMGKEGLIIKVRGAGYQTTNVLKYLAIPKQGGLHYVKLDLNGPSRPFVKQAWVH